MDNDLQVLSQPGGLDSVVPIWPENPGPLSYVVEDCVIEFQATDFTQVNVDVNRQMVRQAVEQLDLSSRDRVGDLFCGVGNFTLPIAATCEAVLGVEGDEYLVRAGSSNAELNAIQNVEFRRLNLHQDNLEEFFRGGNYNKMLLDPPRSGALDVVSSVVPVLQPEKIVYVSCNPATLARDADVLVNKGGYRLVRAGAIDMFPHTAHVESMAVFDRG